jgi:hypothetical protein
MEYDVVVLFYNNAAVHSSAQRERGVWGVMVPSHRSNG